MSKAPAAKYSIMGGPSPALMTFAFGYLLFLYVPLLMLPLFAFNDSAFIAFPLKGYTTKWFEQALADEDMLHALWASIRVALISAIAATALGLLAAKAITRYAFRGRTAVTGFIMLPLFVPEIMLGIALLIILNTVGIPLGLTAVTLSHIILCTPFAISVLISRLEGFDKSLEEASLDLGEGPWMTFWRVTFPLVMPGIISSFLLCFIVSFDDFLIAFFVTGTEQTLPVYIWSQLRFPAKLPSVLAMGVLILAASIVLVVLAEWVRRIGVDDKPTTGI
jgi:spermidine/putrescine transport system permease protein